MVSMKHLIKTEPMDIFAKVNRTFQRLGSGIRYAWTTWKDRTTWKVPANKVTQNCKASGMFQVFYQILRFL